MFTKHLPFSMSTPPRHQKGAKSMVFTTKQSMCSLHGGGGGRKVSVSVEEPAQRSLLTSGQVPEMKISQVGFTLGPRGDPW